MEVYPDNTLANFKVKLGRPMELTGSWEVGLVEIIYPNKSFNVQADEARMFLSKEKTTRINLAKIPVSKAGKKPTAGKRSPEAKLKEAVKAWKSAKVDHERMVREHKKLLVQQVGRVLAEKWLKKGVLPDHYDKVERDHWSIGLEPGVYTSVEDLHQRLGERLKKQHDVKVKLDLQSKMFSIALTKDGWTRKLHMSPRLAELLGYPATDRGYTLSASEKAMMQPQLEGNASSLYVYSSIVENQLVGDTVAPLLRVVCPDANRLGEKVTEKYIRPYYVPVNTNYIDTIDIQIRTTSGHYYPFLSGDPVVLNLHFRQ